MYYFARPPILAFLLGVAVLSPAAARGETGDPVLVSWVDAEYTSTGDFLHRLAGLEEVLRERDDPRAVFAAMYRVLTQKVLASVESGTYEDNEWVARFMVAFGNLYRQAFLDYECGRRNLVPISWQVAFGACAANDVPVFYHGLLGVYAHINHDLPFAIAEVTPKVERAGRFEDYLRTHAVILASIDEVEDAAVDGFDEGLGRLDSATLRLDEKVFAGLLTQWRFRAWRNAAAFEGNGDIAAKGLLATLLDLATGRRARMIHGEGRIR